MTAAAARTDYERFRAAAAGDLEATRELVRECADLARKGDTIAAMEGVLFARLAACTGNVGDIGTLISMLALTNGMLPPDQQVWRDAYQGNVIALVGALADEGNDVAQENIQQLTEESTEGAVQHALVLSAHWKAQIAAKGNREGQ